MLLEVEALRAWRFAGGSSLMVLVLGPELFQTGVSWSRGSSGGGSSPRLGRHYKHTKFITIPDARLKCSSLDVPTMAACYTGIEDPLLVEHRAHVLKDRNTARGGLFRSVDLHGRSLSLYMGPGHARYALHNAIEVSAHQVARLVGFHAARQPRDLVAHAIEPENRERFTGAQRAAAKSHHGGLIPDLVILRYYLPSSDGLPVTRTYDSKTVGYSEKY